MSNIGKPTKELYEGYVDHGAGGDDCGIELGFSNLTSVGLPQKQLLARLHIIIDSEHFDALVCALHITEAQRRECVAPEFGPVTQS